jgi:hypothetical protein
MSGLGEYRPDPTEGNCENRLHFIKDRWWDEDRQWSTRVGLAECLASLRDAALTVLRLIPVCLITSPFEDAPIIWVENLERL